MKYFAHILMVCVFTFGLLFTPGSIQVARAAPAASVQIWSRLGSGIDDYVSDLAVDANNHLYVAGLFSSPGNNIAKWDGNSWSALGLGTNNGIGSLVFDNNNHLYVGGGFSKAGNLVVNQIAKWDGANWSALGSGLALGDNSNTPMANALAVDTSGNLYVGGEFHKAGGVTAHYIAKWNGSTWSALGSGLDGQVYAIAVDQSGNVYVGGDFTVAGSVSANNIAKWDGSTWTAVGSGVGMSDRVYDLLFDGSGNLYAAGRFATADGVTVNHIAKWDGSNWSALGSGLGLGSGETPVINSIVLDGNNNLIVAGYFTKAGGVNADHVAKWNGTSWSAVGSWLGAQWQDDLAVDGTGKLYAGAFVLSAVAPTVIATDPTDGEHPLLGPKALTVNFNGDLLHNGSTYAANNPANYLLVGPQADGFQTTSCANGVNARDRSYKINSVGYNASKFKAQLNINNGTALPMGRYRLFICKSLRDMGGTSMAADVVVSFLVGGRWLAVGSGTNDRINVIKTDENNNVYVGGDFTMAGGISANHIAKWNGYSWSTLGSGLNGRVESIWIDGDDVYVGGEFTIAGGKSAAHIAKWDGTTWSALGSGTDDFVFALVTDVNHNLYAGGFFKTAGGVVANGVAKWDGNAWSALKNGVHGPVYDIAINPYGGLVAAGNFNLNGQNNLAVARWNGNMWGGEITGLARSMDSMGGYVVGYFSNSFNSYELAAGGRPLSGSESIDINGSLESITYDGGERAYVGGLFTTIKNKSIKRVAIWNVRAQNWSPVGDGIDNGSVNVVELDHRGNLYAGGSFTSAEGKPANNIAVWSPDPAINYVPTLLAPANQSQLTENRPAFDWKDVFETNAYTIQIAQDTGFTNLVVNAAVTGSGFTPSSDLPAGVTLYWRVRRNSPTEPRPWSATWSFITANPPSIPNPVAPAENALTKDYTPTLVWSRSTTPAGTTFQKYELQIATNNLFTSPISAEINQPATGNPRYTPTSDLTANMTYYWRVRSSNTLGQYSNWSATRSFRTAIAAPTLTLPTNGETVNDPTPTFTWAAPTGATNYTIQVASDVAFTALTLNISVSDVNFTPASDLAPGTYYWRVIAKGPNGPSSWSEIWSLTIN